MLYIVHWSLALFLIVNECCCNKGPDHFLGAKNNSRALYWSTNRNCFVFSFFIENWLDDPQLMRSNSTGTFRVGSLVQEKVE